MVFCLENSLPEGATHFPPAINTTLATKVRCTGFENPLTRT
jgi:hypothetical protein